jgi:hypothetical protein
MIHHWFKTTPICSNAVSEMDSNTFVVSTAGNIVDNPDSIATLMDSFILLGSAR